jgi:hypothetical protein
MFWGERLRYCCCGDMIDMQRSRHPISLNHREDGWLDVWVLLAWKISGARHQALPSERYRMGFMSKSSGPAFNSASDHGNADSEFCPRPPTPSSQSSHHESFLEARVFAGVFRSGRSVAIFPSRLVIHDLVFLLRSKFYTQGRRCTLSTQR